MLSSSRFRRCSVLAVIVGGLLVAAAPASASHLKGGSVDAALGADGHLTGHVELIYSSGAACPSAPGQTVGGSVAVSGPGGFTSSAPLANAVTSTCLPTTKTERADFDLDLSSAADGAYTVTYSNCCRVTPIANVSGGASASTEYTATIQKAGTNVVTTPAMNSNVALGISTHSAYGQSLNATGTAPLTYLLLQSTTPAQPDYDATAPGTNLVALDSTGRVTIPAGTTSGLTPGAYYVYKVRVVDAAGNSAEREVLLTVSNNYVPVLAGPSAPVDVTAGGTATVPFTALDVDSAQTVTILPAGLPSWVTVNATPGNPAAATLTLSPPAATTAQDLTINVDATDNDATAPMTDSQTLAVHVAAAAPLGVTPPPAIAPVVVPPAATKPPVIALATTTAKVAPTDSRTTSMELACTGAGRCTGTVAVTKYVRPGGGALRRITIGTASFSIAAGRTGTVTLRLTAIGRRVLARAAPKSVSSSVRVTMRGRSKRATVTIVRRP